MPYKYIGRTTDFKGKTLWEIVGNLKNFGVGRYVTRNKFSERYPEPTYMKILKVETLAEPQEKSLDNVRKVKVLVERTFRGKMDSKPVYLESSSYKSDYQLIPKHQEQEFCKLTSSTSTKVNEKILPRFMIMPPLMKQVLMREMKIKGEEVSEPMMEVAYNSKLKKSCRIAEKDEKPTVEFDIGLGTPSTLRLYKGIKLKDSINIK